MLEFVKILAQPIVLERDADGHIVGERVGEPTPLYSEEQVLEFFSTMTAQLAAHNAEQPAEAGAEE